MVFNRIENFKKPVIAAVNGYALGAGFEVTLACTLRAASETAQFGFSEMKWEHYSWLSRHSTVASSRWEGQGAGTDLAGQYD